MGAIVDAAPNGGKAAANEIDDCRLASIQSQDSWGDLTKPSKVKNMQRAKEGHLGASQSAMYVVPGTTSNVIAGASAVQRSGGPEVSEGDMPLQLKLLGEGAVQHMESRPQATRVQTSLHSPSTTTPREVPGQCLEDGGDRTPRTEGKESPSPGKYCETCTP